MMRSGSSVPPPYGLGGGPPRSVSSKPAAPVAAAAQPPRPAAAGAQGPALFQAADYRRPDVSMSQTGCNMERNYGTFPNR